MTQKQYTLIRVTRESVEKLKEVGKKSETYDNIINRLLRLDSEKEQGEPNDTMIHGEGYVAGYNQAEVDFGIKTQVEADIILLKSGEKEVHKE